MHSIIIIVITYLCFTRPTTATWHKVPLRLTTSRLWCEQKRKRKDKFTLFSNHNGSLPTWQGGSLEQVNTSGHGNKSCSPQVLTCSQCSRQAVMPGGINAILIILPTDLASHLRGLTSMPLVGTHKTSKCHCTA